DGALTVLVVNKNLYDPANPSATTPITINLSNFAAGGAAQEWQLAAVNPGNQTSAAITRRADVTVSGNSLTVSVPMESATLFVIPAAPAPTVANVAVNGGTAQRSRVISVALTFSVPVMFAGAPGTAFTLVRTSEIGRAH